MRIQFQPETLLHVLRRISERPETAHTVPHLAGAVAALHDDPINEDGQRGEGGEGSEGGEGGSGGGGGAISDDDDFEYLAFTQSCDPAHLVGPRCK